MGVRASLRGGEQAYQIINGCCADGVHQEDDDMEHQYCPNEGNHGCEASIQSLVGFGDGVFVEVRSESEGERNSHGHTVAPQYIPHYCNNLQRHKISNLLVISSNCSERS